MKEFESLKRYYRPIQPTVKAEDTGIVYLEVQPTREIEHFVYCFWQLKTSQPLKYDYHYRVVSDGCIDIFFDHRQLAESFVMGFCRKYTEFPIGKEFNYIGIRFLPAAFPLLFKIDAKILANQAQELKNILPDFADWIQASISSSYPFEVVTEMLNEKISIYLEKQEFYYDSRFLNALQLILKKKGHLDTEKELNTGLSPRQLRRIFNYYIGTTAKSFSNVVRFQYILNAQPTSQSLKENKLYLDVGFFDQAHFIKNFKTFYGVTPSEAFR
ncbi:helix-turn-helix domain-containing protein [Flammeovirga sp. OC4]|uniref:AraC family transcriptional regulator n=1 Tax=Flammeovirga sp. OC4 TaxID=1382345 RepID=UPI0005C45910|nr:helix-turn-helix domain-containing protein [Flammeovirga sp. OC4]